MVLIDSPFSGCCIWLKSTVLLEYIFTSQSSIGKSFSSIAFSSIYSILTRGNYAAWEREFKEFYEDFQRDQNIHLLLSTLSKLFNEFKIESRIVTEVRKLGPEDLVLVGCMFLVNPAFKELNILAP